MHITLRPQSSRWGSPSLKCDPRFRHAAHTHPTFLRQKPQSVAKLLFPCHSSAEQWQWAMTNNRLWWGSAAITRTAACDMQSGAAVWQACWAMLQTGVCSVVLTTLDFDSCQTVTASPLLSFLFAGKKKATTEGRLHNCQPPSRHLWHQRWHPASLETPCIQWWADRASEAFSTSLNTLRKVCCCLFGNYLNELILHFIYFILSMPYAIFSSKQTQPVAIANQILGHHGQLQVLMLNRTCLHRLIG